MALRGLPPFLAAMTVCLFATSCSGEDAGRATAQEAAEAYIAAINAADVEGLLAIGEPEAERERAELALEAHGGEEFVPEESWSRQYFHGTCSVRFDGSRGGARETLYVMVYEDEGRWFAVLPFGEDGPGMWTDEEVLEELGYDDAEDIPDVPGEEWVTEEDSAPCPS
ncbi:hypothetical protein [Nocardiopsis lambiniae]|uniref:DUF4878 domain-containing protein n=1 Tax=Nocardiopsis lambiniae TaxID=3075539 RepID=A0ABU2M9J8_9ACTN|nr:hypothetical protein [Nocardiopsis sp. DSM 44743]MDT0329217.1 hypothetical protein [Nocardiopsis sp. DSM 44743]